MDPLSLPGRFTEPPSADRRTGLRRYDLRAHALGPRGGLSGGLGEFDLELLGPPGGDGASLRLGEEAERAERTLRETEVSLPFGV